MPVWVCLIGHLIFVVGAILAIAFELRVIDGLNAELAFTRTEWIKEQRLRLQHERDLIEEKSKLQAEIERLKGGS